MSEARNGWSLIHNCGGGKLKLLYLLTNLGSHLSPPLFSFPFIIPFCFSVFGLIFINGCMRIRTIATFQRCYLWPLSKHKAAIFWLLKESSLGHLPKVFKLQRIQAWMAWICVAPHIWFIMWVPFLLGSCLAFIPSQRIIMFFSSPYGLHLRYNNDVV